MGGGKQDSTAAEASAQQADVRVTATMAAEYQAYSASRDHDAFSSLTLTAPQYDPEETDRGNLDLVVVLDKSGSMSGDKLELVKKTTEFMVKNLRPVDRLGVVAYDSDVSTLIDLTTMDAAGRKKAENKIASLSSGSCTNLSGGLFRGIDMVQRRAQKSQVTSVLLMTDGIANEGVTNKDQLVEAMRKLMGDKGEFSVYTFGYGRDHNADLLKALSESGNGMYYYIEDTDSIPQAFADCLGGLLSTVAQNIKIKLTTDAAANGVRFKAIHTRFHNKNNAGSTVSEITMGDLQSEESRDIAFEVTLPCVDEPHDEPRPYVTATIEYFNVASGAIETVECTLDLSRPAEVPEGSQQPVKHILEQRLRVQTVDVIKRANEQASHGNLSAAREMLTSSLAEMKKNVAITAYAQELCDDMQNCLDGVRDQLSWRTTGIYEMASSEQTHAYQRSNRAAHSRGFVSYVTSVKGRMKAKSSRFMSGEE